MDEASISFRPFKEDDLNFITNSWMKSYKKHAGVRSDVYFVEHHKLIHFILRKSHILIACNSQNADQIFGYIVYEKNIFTIIHFAFVKQMFRGIGIFKQLFDEASVTSPFLCSHDTRYNQKEVLGKVKIFNPYKSFGDYYNATSTGSVWTAGPIQDIKSKVFGLSKPQTDLRIEGKPPSHI